MRIALRLSCVHLEASSCQGKTRPHTSCCLVARIPVSSTVHNQYSFSDFVSCFPRGRAPMWPYSRLLGLPSCCMSSRSGAEPSEILVGERSRTHWHREDGGRVGTNEFVRVPTLEIAAGWRWWLTDCHCSAACNWQSTPLVCALHGDCRLRRGAAEMDGVAILAC